MTNLPSIIAKLKGHPSLPNLSGLSSEDALKTLQQALKLMKRQVAARKSTLVRSNSSPAKNASLGHNNHHPKESPLNALRLSTSGQNSGSLSSGRYAHHSHSVDGIRHELDMLIKNRSSLNHSPGSESESSTRSPPSENGHPTTSGNATNSVMAAASSSKPSVPTLTPSLANYFRENLIEHVTGWPADLAERQANKYADEAHNLGSLNCTRVSAELKMARSLVRLTEIQATLQEQRILFVRQQIKEVDEWKSQSAYNSYS
jgi:hypothetical protein